jgi:hypothetical protein
MQVRAQDPARRSRHEHAAASQQTSCAGTRREACVTMELAGRTGYERAATEVASGSRLKRKPGPEDVALQKRVTHAG